MHNEVILRELERSIIIPNRVNWEEVPNEAKQIFGDGEYNAIGKHNEYGWFILSMTPENPDLVISYIQTEAIKGDIQFKVMKSCSYEFKEGEVITLKDSIKSSTGPPIKVLMRGQITFPIGWFENHPEIFTKI